MGLYLEGAELHAGAVQRDGGGTGLAGLSGAGGELAAVGDLQGAGPYFCNKVMNKVKDNLEQRVVSLQIKADMANKLEKDKNKLEEKEKMQGQTIQELKA